MKKSGCGGNESVKFKCDDRAARAGESGRGFAVVADQIQKLADQSSQSSLEIEDTSRKLMEDSAK